MDWIDHLEARFARYPIENITSYLLVGQIIAYILSYTAPFYRNYFYLQGTLVASGQWYRLITVLFTPITDNLIFAALTWYLLYLYGTQLEQRWGSFRYLIYLLISYLGGLITAMIFPSQIIGNGYLYASQFLAFAFLYPDVQFMIFFILPVKAKWLGIIGWLAIASTVLTGNFATQVLVLLSVSNFFLFFWKDLRYLVRTNPLVPPLIKPRQEQGIRNECALCGKDELSYRLLDFRYCTDCDPPTCYCPDHIDHHRHRVPRRSH